MPYQRTLVHALLCAAAGGAIGTVARPLAAQTAPVAIQEWPVPWAESRPRDPAVAADGRIWFVGQRTHYVASFDPTTGQFRKFDLPPGTGPHNIIVDRHGMLWFSGNLVANIGRMDPADGSITTFPMPDPAARDPHTLIEAPTGQIWFTVQGGNFVGRLTPASGAVELLPVPTPRARPYGIALDSHGAPWINLLGTNKLATVDPATLTLREIALPRAGARTRRIVVTPDDMVWSVDYAEGYLIRYDPATGTVAEWRSPGGADARPYAMAGDDRGRLWLVETGPRPNRLVGFDPAREEFMSVTPIPSGAGTVRHMVFDPATRTLWFGTDANTLGRADVP